MGTTQSFLLFADLFFMIALRLRRRQLLMTIAAAVVAVAVCIT